MTRSCFFYTALSGAVAIILAGCAGFSKETPARHHEGESPASETRTVDNYTAKRELAVAVRMVKGGEYSLVIPRLEQLIAAYPGDSAAIEARYYLGLSYYNVGGYADAAEHFRQYQSLDPNGSMAASAEEYLAKLNGGATISPAKLDQKIQTAKAAADARPEDMAAQLNLANLYWDGAYYEEAGVVYTRLVHKWPQLMNDTVVRTRMVRETNGQLTVLSPQEAERRLREQEPLFIYNVASFRSGRFENFSRDARERFYNVTGQAVNRSEKALDDVQVIVTIYGFGQMVYDTQTVSIGRMQPGEVRAFNVQFSRFDNINNITRHECRGTFRR